MPAPARQPVQVALIFHCNQAVSTFAQVAAENCYRGLVRVLLRHPRSRFNFHWSGSLLTSLGWWYPDLVETIRREAARGRWEILASTYAQNVPYTGPPALNRLALGVHRGILRAAFPEVTPRGHWISERSWRPEMADEILDAGLDYTLIEDHMLAAAGCTDLSRPRRFAHDSGRDLVVFTDNEDFKHPFNAAVWTGDTRPVLEYLRRVRREGTECGLPPVVTYAEDAEVCGLWNIQRGSPPQIAWEHLDRLLTALEEEPGVELIRLSDHLDSHRRAIPADSARLGHGQARWMCASLADAHLPYHEDGYSDWFDFNRRAEKLRRFRPIFRRAAADVLAARPRGAKQRRLVLHAAINLAAHTFEFGCIGIGSRRGELWERHRVARLPLALSDGAAPPASGPVDLNADRRQEHALVTPGLLSLWSRRTGALLHLFDRATGDELVGNENATHSIFGRGHDDEMIPDGRAPEPTWSGFRSSRQRLEDFRGLWRNVPRSKSWMRWLLDWDALGRVPREIRQVRLAPGENWRLEDGRRDEAAFLWPPRVRQRALVERLAVDGEEIVDVAAISRDTSGRARLHEKDGALEITLARNPITLTKRIRQRGREIRVTYEIENRSRETRDLTLTVTSEWVPSYLTILLFGRRSVEVTSDGARNALTGAAVQLALAGTSADRDVAESMLGLLDQRTVSMTLAPSESRTLSARLTVERGTTFGHIDDIAKEWRTWCGQSL
jgi:hypothetical protein